MNLQMLFSENKVISVEAFRHIFTCITDTGGYQQRLHWSTFYRPRSPYWPLKKRVSHHQQIQYASSYSFPNIFEVKNLFLLTLYLLPEFPHILHINLATLADPMTRQTNTIPHAGTHSHIHAHTYPHIHTLTLHPHIHAITLHPHIHTLTLYPHIHTRTLYPHIHTLTLIHTCTHSHSIHTSTHSHIHRLTLHPHTSPQHLIKHRPTKQQRG